MVTQFEAWLQQLGSAGKRIKPTIPIDRGLPFAFIFSMQGDWAGSQISASLRLFPDAGGDTLADLTCAEPAYDPIDDLTIFSMTLTGAQTQDLPSDALLEGVVRVAIDIVLRPAGYNPFRLMGGVATIVGKVTNAS